MLWTSYGRWLSARGYQAFSYLVSCPTFNSAFLSLVWIAGYILVCRAPIENELLPTSSIFLTAGHYVITNVEIPAVEEDGVGSNILIL